MRDPAAARTRALVLALTGDTEGANRAAQAAMPGGQADAMAPFLARLPSLSVPERALAVHFGHFPGEGGAVATSSGLYASLEPVTAAGAPDPRQPALGGPRRTPPPEPASTEPRRRPDANASAQRPARTTVAPAPRTGQPGQRAGTPAARQPARPEPVVL